MLISIPQARLYQISYFIMSFPRTSRLAPLSIIKSLLLSSEKIFSSALMPQAMFTSMVFELLLLMYLPVMVALMLLELSSLLLQALFYVCPLKLPISILSCPNFVELVQNTPEVNTLESLVVASNPTSNLITTLNGSTTYTVFAPTETAIAALPACVVALLSTNLGLLTDILNYHVVTGTIFSDVIASGSSSVTPVFSANGICFFFFLCEM